jgi:hypothetical protein
MEEAKKHTKANSPLWLTNSSLRPTAIADLIEKT